MHPYIFSVNDGELLLNNSSGSLKIRLDPGSGHTYFDSDGYVGIGTNNPTEKLDVEIQINNSRT